MALLFWMLKHLGALKGFFAMKPAIRKVDLLGDMKFALLRHERLLEF